MQVAHKGRTSLGIHVLVTRRSFADDSPNKDSAINQYAVKPEIEICHCDIVFVAVDAKGHSRPWR